MNRGFFAIGMYRPKTEHNLGTLWRSAHALGASMIFTIGHRYTRQASDTSAATRHVPYIPYPTWDVFRAARPFNAPLVGVELTPRANNLLPFEHPETAVYLLGPEDGSLGGRILAECQYVVSIPSAFCLNVATAGSIVMYDRLAKLKGGDA